jgi:hypothetical protein
LLGLITWLEELDNIGDDNKVSCEDSAVTRLGLVDNAASQDDIDRAGHGSCWDIT